MPRSVNALLKDKKLFMKEGSLFVFMRSIEP
jgi:hypothetical protein